MSDDKYAPPIDIDALTKKVQKGLGENADRYRKMAKPKLSPKEREKQGIIEMPNDSHLDQLTEEQKKA